MQVPRTAAIRREEGIVVLSAMSGAIGRTVALGTIGPQLSRVTVVNIVYFIDKH